MYLSGIKAQNRGGKKWNRHKLARFGHPFISSVATDDRGRNKVDIQEGVIQKAYPSVFTVLVDDEREENSPQLLSFSYTDIITKDIRMKLC